MYAVIETGGKQYKVENGDIVFVEKLSAADDSTVDFKVVAVGGEDGLKIGTPYVDGASVTGKVLKTGKGKKITVMTYKPKKGEKRKMGHRQPYTKGGRATTSWPRSTASLWRRPTWEPFSGPSRRTSATWASTCWAWRSPSAL